MRNKARRDVSWPLNFFDLLSNGKLRALPENCQLDAQKRQAHAHSNTEKALCRAFSAVAIRDLHLLMACSHLKLMHFHPWPWAFIALPTST